VYPGAGFICPAIEAAVQMTTAQGEKMAISDFSLRDIDIKLALIVLDNADGVEIQSTLTPISDKTIGTQG